MGLTKQYRRFVSSGRFGLVGSSRVGGLLHVPGRPNAVLTACAESVAVWDVRRAEKVGDLSTEDNKYEVTALAVAADGDGRALLAAGYHDGAVRIFDVDSGDCQVTLNGHRSAVTSLAFDSRCQRLASGSRDTDLVVWDVVAESGLFRLKGHKGAITRCLFMKGRRNVLVSASRDTLVKFWDLDIQHCFNTVATHMTEVWDVALVKGEKYLVTGSGDSELRMFRLTFKDSKKEKSGEGETNFESNMKKLKVSLDGEEDDEESSSPSNDSNLLVEKVGSILRAGQDKVSRIVVDSRERLLCCHGADNSVELFLVCGEDEVKKRCQKRAKKERRKVAAAKKEDGEAVVEEESVSAEPSIAEEFRRLKSLRAGGKVRGLDVEVSRQGGKGVLTVLTANNMVERHSLDLEERGADAEAKGGAVSQQGHRSDVRSVAFSSDNTAILSGSHEAVKIWSRSAQTCLRTIPTGYVLSSFFVPGDRQAVVGTKSGSLQILDVSSSQMLEEIPGAHGDKAVWSLDLCADGRSFVSAGADATVRFWDLQLVRLEGDDERAAARLSAVHRRTLKLDDEALAVRCGADGRFLAVSLLDMTVRVFYADSLKFLHKLYGHSQPALCLDMSTDSQILVSGGGDKSVKIWGLDHGDCRRSLLAHERDVVAVRFLPDTHMFFSAGKDGKVKQWDGDKFERIVTLDGHHGEIWDLCVSPNGKWVVSAGHDKTLRLWERSEEVLVLEDERETEREREGDQELATGDARVLPGEQNKESGLPTNKTAESEKGAERLMEALELHNSHLEDPSQTLPPLMLAYGASSPQEYVLKIIASIKSSELEQTLLVLPFSVVVDLLRVMETLLGKDCPSSSSATETVCKMFLLCLEVHFGPLSTARELHPLISRLRALAQKRLESLKDLVGFNLSALDFALGRRAEREAALQLEETVLRVKEKRRRKKNKEKALQTTVLTL